MKESRQCCGKPGAIQGLAGLRTELVRCWDLRTVAIFPVISIWIFEPRRGMVEQEGCNIRVMAHNPLVQGGSSRL